MDITYEDFLSFNAVVNVKTEREFNELINRCKSLKLDTKILERIGFREMHKNAGMWEIPFGELCIEYSPHKGFTRDKIEPYEKYGVTIISVEEFLKITE